MFMDVDVLGGEVLVSLVTCCREICSEQGGRAIGKEKKEKKIQT